jgi:hypothetical protein
LTVTFGQGEDVLNAFMLVTRSSANNDYDVVEVQSSSNGFEFALDCVGTINETRGSETTAIRRYAVHLINKTAAPAHFSEIEATFVGRRRAGELIRVTKPIQLICVK